MNPTVITDIPLSILSHRLSNYNEDYIIITIDVKCISNKMHRGVHSVGQTIKLKQTDMETHNALLTLQC